MNNPTAESTVGALVRAFPARARVFENLGIDYCCGGKQPLGDACRNRSLDPDTVIAMLTALDDLPEVAESDPNVMTLSELCDHIERVHHGYLREELPRLDFMTRKVAAVHGDSEPRLLDVRRVFEKFNEMISAHSTEEDGEIFPAIRKLESAEDKTEAASKLHVAFAKLEEEHERTGSALATLRELTDGYAPPDWACNTFRAMYDGLQRMERDMRRHIHKENNVLFPKALALA